MFLYIRSALFSLLFLVPFTTALASDVLFRLDFDSFGEAVLHNRFFKKEGLQTLPRVGWGGSSALRVTYFGNNQGSQRVVHAFQLKGSDSSAATLSFRVKFCPGFDFALGGKLHGLGPKLVASGGAPVANGSWSGRVVFAKSGGIGVYVYHLEQWGRFGDFVGARDFRFETAKWYRVELYVRLNAPNKKNGLVRLFVDDELLVDLGGLVFWRPPAMNYEIRKFLFSTFYGGNSELYAPKDDGGNVINTCADFDDFVVYSHQD